MATNFIQDGDQIYLATATGMESGDPFLYGDYRPCVLLTDAETDSPYNATVKTSGVFDLSVEAVNASGDSAVSIGDMIFYTSTDDPVLNKKGTGKPFGVALEAIDAGETATINVLINPVFLAASGIATADIADDAVTLDKLVNITQGSILVGGASDAPTELAAETSGQILVGDGTDLKSVAVSGDVTISTTGVVTVGAGKIDQRMLDPDHTYETFNCSPVVTQITGEVSDGTDEDTLAMCCGRNMFEFFNIGTQSLLAPTIAADGLLCSLDLTAGEGVEYTQGITSRGKHAYKIGTDAAFYLKVGLKIADVSEVAECAVGFRKAEAYNDGFDDYNDLASLNVQAGTINIETILNNNATTTTDTTDSWADGEEHVLEVYVSAAGVVTYKIDGAAPTATAAFTLDTGDTVIPFFHLIHGTTPAAVHLQSWECGLQ